MNHLSAVLKHSQESQKTDTHTPVHYKVTLTFWRLVLDHGHLCDTKQADYGESLRSDPDIAALFGSLGFPKTTKNDLLFSSVI